MKGNKRRQQNGAEERATALAEPQPSYYSTPSNAYNYSMTLIASKLIDESLKISRRYSFDDNGGGYQGL